MVIIKPEKIYFKKIIIIKHKAKHFKFMNDNLAGWWNNEHLSI
jgi:hypothetical protein